MAEIEAFIYKREIGDNVSFYGMGKRRPVMERSIAHFTAFQFVIFSGFNVICYFASPSFDCINRGFAGWNRQNFDFVVFIIFYFYNCLLDGINGREYFFNVNLKTAINIAIDKCGNFEIYFFIVFI